MSPRAPGPSRDQLVAAATDLFRRNGYVATTVDQICTSAGVSKGAFFHHFASKEAIVKACLELWGQHGVALFEQGSFSELEDPVERCLGCMTFMIEMFSDPGLLKSCLAGTVVQEVSETHPEIRSAANDCFVLGERRFESLLSEACQALKLDLDTAELASLWWATLQGSMVRAKASRDESVIPSALEHVKNYIQLLFDR